MKIGCVLLAAGAGRRFGGGKLLSRVEGEPMMERALRLYASAPFAARVCVTRAEQGCLLVGASEIADVPGAHVDVVDAVGAGDAFTAALIWAQLRGWRLAQVATFANRVGALVAGSPGAMPVLARELERLISEARGQTDS